VVWAYTTVMVLMIAPVALWNGLPETGGRFWGLMPLTAVLAALSSFLYFRAVRASDLSITVPMLAFTPLFMCLTSPFITGEFPDAAGLAGIACIVFGSYLLHLSQRSQGLFAPWLALVREPGPRWMLLTAFLWGVTASLDKVGIFLVPTSFWVFSVLGLASLLQLGMCLALEDQRPWRAFRQPAVFALAGLEVASLAFQMAALRMTLAAYVISIKRLSVVFAVILAGTVLREAKLSERLLGAAVMAAGVALILL